MQRRNRIGEIPTAARRGDAAKVIIITVCVFAMVLMLMCVGAGVYGYVLFQRNFGRMVVQTPTEVQKLTTEITDIEIPPQFTPIMGSAIFGMKTVTYAWNPGNKPMSLENWQNSRDSVLSNFNLMEMSNDQAVSQNDFKIAEYEKKVLKSQYGEYTETIREFDIRGKKCEFLFVTGRAKEGAFEDEAFYDAVDEEEMVEEEAADAAAAVKPAEGTKVETPAAADAVNPADPVETPAAAPAGDPAPADAIVTPPAEAPAAKPEEKLLPPVHTVSGKFPGKSGPTTISIRVPAGEAAEDLLLKIVQSIH